MQDINDTIEFIENNGDYDYSEIREEVETALRVHHEKVIKEVLEFLKLKCLCRIRGLKTDIDNGYQFESGLKEYEELLRHLEKLDYIDADISCAEKYLNKKEKQEFIILRKKLLDKVECEEE